MLNQSIHPLKSYGAAFLSVAVALIVRALLHAFIGSTVPYVTFYPAVIFSALYGGYRAGILAALLAAIAVTVWIEPVGSFNISNPADQVGFILFLCVAGLIVWICERTRRANFEVAAINRKNTTILESISDAFFALDPDWRFTYVNAKAEEFLGKRREDLIGRNIWEEFPRAKGSIFEEMYRKVLLEKVALNFEAQSTLSERWLEVNAYPSIGGLSIYSRDITARKQSEKEREELLERERESREAAEAANLLKDDFLATVSHELRTPLNSILGWASMAQGNNFSPENIKRALEIIERNAKSQNSIIEDILDVSRIITGKFSLNRSEVKLASIIENSLDSVRPAVEAKRIEITTDFCSEDATVYGDADRLQQVIWNLLSNAVKFTPEQGHIEILLEQVNSHFNISVRDTGKGIEPEFLPFVFERFRQAEGGTNRQYGGLGLGLAIVRHITELHGGTVSAQSEGKGKGSTFTVSLPIENSLAEMNKSISPNQQNDNDGNADFSSQPLSGTLILVVDDEPDALELVRMILIEQGAIVITADSVDSALAKLNEAFPDVLISDIGMPVKDGFDLIKEIKRLHSQSDKLKTIALTAYARKEDEQRVLSEGFQRYLSKPVQIPQLIKTIIEIKD